MNLEASAVAGFAERVLPLATAQLDPEYYYQSISLCVIDAIYSIGVRYEGVRNVIDRYCGHFGLRRLREPKHVIPDTKEQESVGDFCTKIERFGTSAMALNIYRNSQRTSAVGGILKADAVYRFASVLRRHEIEYLQDIGRAISNPRMEEEIRAIPGQKSGISLQYFFMLAGSDDLVKPDRMVLGFLERVLRRQVTPMDAQKIMVAAANELKTKYTRLTPRLLDNIIWNYQRTTAKV